MSAGRPRVHVYRLLVSWPDPGSVQARWPQPHLYLSRSGAQARAQKMRADGAVVDIERSAPVEWPEAGNG